MGTPLALAIVLRFRKLIATFVVVIAFFSYYNIFLIDNTLESLKFSLEQTALAYDIEDTNGLDMLLSQATAKEVSPTKMNAFDLGNLEYATSIINTGRNFNQLDYLKTTLATIIKGKEKERGILLAALDRINRPIRKGIVYLAYLPRYLARPRIAEAQTSDNASGVIFLEKLRTIEREGNLKKAIGQYEKLLVENKGTDKASLVMLRLAYTFHRLGEFDKALKLYKTISKEYWPQKNAQIAQILINALSNKDKVIAQIDKLLIQYNEISQDEKEKRQEALYSIGVAYTKLFDLEEAQSFFKRSIEVEPMSELGTKAQFNMAWILKQKYKLIESSEQLQEIVKQKPSSDLILETRTQLANVYQAQGKYQNAIDIQLKLADEYKEQPVAALYLFQAGASYMYDLNDTKKAKEIFARLTKMYPKAEYSQFLSPKKGFIGTFLTYVVPRATRVITWRIAGLFCLSGYFGELTKATMVSEEAGLNVAINDWVLEEFPDTLGNIYFDMKGIEVDLLEGNVAISGIITFGRFSVRAEAEFKLELQEDKKINLVITKAFLNKIPIPPILINQATKKLFLLINKYFPISVEEITMEEGKMVAWGYGSKRILKRIKQSSANRLAAETKLEDIIDPDQQKEIYTSFKEKFPASNFSPSPIHDTEDLFLDFFTRLSMYAGFKLLETVKDSKLDYQRSIRTVGRLMLEESRFRITYSEKHINVSINRFVSNEFPWVVNKKFMFDVIGLKFDFKDNGEIKINANLGLGYGEAFLTEPKGVKLDGSMVIEIDKDSKIPRLVFKEINLNGKPFPVEKLNVATTMTLDLLKDAHLPFKLEEIKVFEDGITLKGKAPRDFAARIFSDPYLFVIFHVREWDLGLAGIERVKKPYSQDYKMSMQYEQYRGRAFEKGGYEHPRVYTSE